MGSKSGQRNEEGVFAWRAGRELKAAQRSFFSLLYQLLVGRDTGPRLPTLLLTVGPDRIRKLLAG